MKRKVSLVIANTAEVDEEGGGPGHGSVDAAFTAHV